jgi:hypothetical protein
MQTRSTWLVRRLESLVLVAGLTAALGGLAAAVVPGEAQAGPFKDGDLFSGRTMKMSMGDRKFYGGVHLQAAPVKAVMQKVVKDQVDKKVKENPQAAGAVELIKYVPTEDIKAAADSGQIDEFKVKMKAELQAQGKLTPEAEAQINGLDAQKIKTMAEIVELYNSPQEVLTFAFEPYIGGILGPVEASVRMPMAGAFTEEDGTSLEFGNLAVDLRAGTQHAMGPVGFAWTVGATGYAPTASEDADAVSLSNPLATPKFRSGYAGAAGYGMVGFDFTVIRLSARGEYVELRPIDEINSFDILARVRPTIRYATAGGALQADLGIVGLSAEVDHIIGLAGADDLNGQWLATAGARFFLGAMQLGVAAQAPFNLPTSTTAKPQSVVGEPAAFNVIVQAQFKI